MKIVVLILLMLSTPLSAAPISRLEDCEALLTLNPRFQFGQVTNKNETPDEIFASPVTNTGQPRLLMTVGISGSGKTAWASHADRNEWAVINIDEIRTEILKRRGLDPLSSENHFAPDILQSTQQELNVRMESAFALGRSIVLDQNNLTPVRAAWSIRGRALGYHVEALVFSSKDVNTNIANIHFRKEKGIDISDEAIISRYEQFKFFNQFIRLAGGESGPTEVATDISPFLKLSASYPSLQQALEKVNIEQRSQLEAQLRADHFDAAHFVWTPNMTEMPHDTPVLRTTPRIYAAITNKCNRACPWCSVYSNPYKNTFLEPIQLVQHFPAEENFDLQLEGGEPTIHPKLFEFVEVFRRRPNAGRLILITNGVKLPRTEEELRSYILKFGKPFTMKLSINHYLLDNDKFLIEKAQLLRKVIDSLGSDYQLIFNVRLRRGQRYNDDAQVLETVRSAGLEPFSNVFFLQRYGLASGQSEWEAPFTVNNGFKLLNPDGSAYTGTLEERADKMGNLK